MSKTTTLYRAHRIMNKNENVCDLNWYEGDLIHSAGEVFIHPIDKYANVIVEHGYNYTLKEVVYKVDTGTLCRCTGKYDMAGQLVFQNDVIENPDGLRMVIRYGTYEAYCPVDNNYMESIGFYVEAAGMAQMPIGNLSEYARVIGNLIDTPDILTVSSADIVKDTILSAEGEECCPACEKVLNDESLYEGRCSACGQLLNCILC